MSSDGSPCQATVPDIPVYQVLLYFLTNVEVLNVAAFHIYTHSQVKYADPGKEHPPIHVPLLLPSRRGVIPSSHTAYYIIEIWQVPIPLLTSISFCTRIRLKSTSSSTFMPFLLICELRPLAGKKQFKEWWIVCSTSLWKWRRSNGTMKNCSAWVCPSMMTPTWGDKDKTSGTSPITHAIFHTSHSGVPSSAYP